jgi:prevent-host-death family protein
MNKIGAFEAKNTLGSSLDRVEQGEQIVITRHGKAVARLVPATGAVDRSQAHSAAERIRTRSAQVAGRPLDWEELNPKRTQAGHESGLGQFRSPSLDLQRRDDFRRKGCCKPSS